jgi:hypothetical protein
MRRGTEGKEGALCDVAPRVLELMVCIFPLFCGCTLLKYPVSQRLPKPAGMFPFFLFITLYL